MEVVVVVDSVLVVVVLMVDVVLVVHMSWKLMRSRVRCRERGEVSVN